MVDEQNLGIPAMQESHPDDAAARDFDKIYNRWFGLINSPSAINTSSTAGVAFLLNRKFIDVDHVQVFHLDPGRALLISVPWHKGQTLNILNIYAPNTPRDREELWIRLWTQWKENPRLPLPDVVLGDWNFIEDPRDRLSARKETVPISFNRLKSLFQMEDGWRNTFPDDRQYTCIQRRTNPFTGMQYISRSRLDRIYVKHSIFEACRGWRIDPTALRTDHALVAMQIVCRGEEKLGKGRFSLPLYLLKTRKFTEEVHRLGKVLKADCEKLKDIPRSSEDNIQKLWEQFKLDTIEYAKKCSLIIESEMTKKLRTWKAQLYLIIHDTSMGADDRNLSAYLLEN
ncbi:Endonuclease/exonuclease/phosphatase, partial [Mycena capillaripes]